MGEDFESLDELGLLILEDQPYTPQGHALPRRPTHKIPYNVTMCNSPI